MREINIGRILLENRRRQNITQDELATHMGVSKACISKWETAATYPDITLLPRLASFFNISIDELMGYEPQMTVTEIRKLYQQISHDFFTKPFDQVMAYCRTISKKYFSCFPLLFQVGTLYLNHCTFAKTPKKIIDVLEEARELFVRVKEESDNASLKEQALNMEAFCLLKLGRGEEVTELLSDFIPLKMPSEPLLAEAYQMIGQNQKAKQILQAGIYQSVLELLNLLLSYTKLCVQDEPSFEETSHRILSIADSFQLESLHPSILLTTYFSLAQEYMNHEQEEKALVMLEKYSKLAVSDIYPLSLHGDTYFTLLDDWLKENLTLGNQLPRQESLVRKEIASVLTDTQIFASLADNVKFQEIVRRLEREKGAPL